MSDLCRICGLPRSSHHEFDPEPVQSRPSGCVCDAGNWYCDPIPPVCGQYVEDDEFPGQCKTCEHQRECHAKEGASEDNA
jgi:hypothetical protein